MDKKIKASRIGPAYAILVDIDFTMHVVTDDGIVMCWLTSHNGGITKMQFPYKGKMYSKVFNKRYSQRYLITLCKRFTNEVLEGLPK